jgi:hypothetical protein
MYLKTCWSPCFWHPNVRSGSFAVALYTLLLSICTLTYMAYVMNGGESSQLYLPMFEANLSSTTQSGGAFNIIFCIYFIIASVILIFGIKSDIRGLMLPWMAGMGLVILFQATFGSWLIFGYYIYLEMVFAALVNWSWMAYNIYCFMVVRSHFINVKWFQSPDVEILDEYAQK